MPGSESVLGRMVDLAATPAAWLLERRYMALLGLNRTMRLAHRYNSLRHGRYLAFRRRQFQEHFEALLHGNGPPARPPLEMHDGWAIDTSGRLPHVEALVEQSERIIAARGGRLREHFGRPFFQDILADDDGTDVFREHPALLDFPTSSDVLSTVSRYMKMVPYLSQAQPRGIRLNESDRRFDEAPDAPPRSSQLFHLDPYNVPDVYVIVALRDVTPEHGPFCFLPASQSRRVAEAVGYGARGVPYRISDEQVYAVANPDSLIRFEARAGSVLFVDSSACFHFGSRNCLKPRYQMMYAFVSPCRSDFTDLLKRPLRYPVAEGDSPLRRMVLDRFYLRDRASPPAAAALQGTGP